jgi:glycerol-3-phosphate dehydrogenase
MTRRIPPDISTADFDAVIIGAGINGCGIARDAALRGLRVLVLDKGDIGGGTTAWSTRLIHGGLRYLEHGELGLVRESLRERETLLSRVAPHLVRPLPLLVPTYANRRRGPFTILAGMIAYDLLSPGNSLPPHQMLTPAEALRRAPGLEPEGLKGAALFYDAQAVYAERLALENALDARDRGATVLTHARVVRLIVERGAARGVEFEDLLGGATRTATEGATHVATGGTTNGAAGDVTHGAMRDTTHEATADATHAARARVVLNVAGPWVDEVLAGADGGARLIGGTKGSHLVVPSFHGAPDAALYAEAAADARPFFIIPWDGKYLIGTTDERYAGDLDRVRADEREIEYLLRETNRMIPSARLKRSDILYTYSGVRPLPYVARGDESAVTRRHFICPSRVAGLFSVVGGKLTTYRSLAEEAVNLIFKQLGKTFPPCATATTPLPGAAVADFEAFAAEFRSRSPLPAKSSERLLKVYGVRASEVLRLALEDAGLRETISEETGSIGAEVVFAFRSELAETLVDCLMRRTMLGLNSRTGLDAVEAAARIAQKFLGWDERRAAREVEDYRRYAARFQAVSLF